MFDFTFNLENTSSWGGRAGKMATAHGDVFTPIFMPVGTAASVKALDNSDLESAQAQIILGNTYHLYLRPGLDVLRSVGGMRGLMGWSKPILTDSGGFQVFSLGEQLKKNQKEAKNTSLLKPAKISDESVVFTSHLDGSTHEFTPERSIEIQRAIGADIIMAFDECLPDDVTRQRADASIERTHRWAQQCVSYWEEKGRTSEYGEYQALFGIIQGGLDQELRERSAKSITSLDFDGIAVGGETIGYNMPGTADVMGWIEHLLPIDKPRYAMGLGRDPQDIVTAVRLGFDMFDCVAPTRMARNGALYVGELDDRAGGPQFRSDFNKGRLRIGTAEYALDQRVIQSGCDCYTCTQGYSRAYLHHLYKAAELSYYRLASIHNVRFMIRLTEQLRELIMRGSH